MTAGALEGIVISTPIEDVQVCSKMGLIVARVLLVSNVHNLTKVMEEHSQN